MLELHEQLAAALDAKGWTVEELLTRSKLPLSRSVLQRKLTGKAPMRTREAQILALTLEATIKWPARTVRAA